MFDASRLLEQMVRSNLGKKKKRKRSKGFGGAAFGGIDHLARRSGIPGGGLGLLGGLAIAAFEHLNQQRTTGTAGPGHMPSPMTTPPPPPPPSAARATPPPPPPPVGSLPGETPPAGTTGAPGDRGSAVVVEADGEAEADKAMLLIEAMIEAAKADGSIDAEERTKILGRLDAEGADPEARSFVEARMVLPPAPDRLIEKLAPEDPGNRLLAAEVYVASLLAIEVDTDAERRYLRDLGKRLQLDDGLIRHLHDDLGVERP